MSALMAGGIGEATAGGACGGSGGGSGGGSEGGNGGGTGAAAAAAGATAGRRAPQRFGAESSEPSNADAAPAASICAPVALPTACHDRLATAGRWGRTDGRLAKSGATAGAGRNPKPSLSRVPARISMVRGVSKQRSRQHLQSDAPNAGVCMSSATMLAGAKGNSPAAACCFDCSTLSPSGGAAALRQQHASAWANAVTLPAVFAPSFLGPHARARLENVRVGLRLSGAQRSSRGYERIRLRNLRTGRQAGSGSK